MPDFKLILGNKNYSSWSLRPYLALSHVGVPFDEVVIPLRHADTAERIAAHSPSGRVPVLVHGDLTVWDSLAICEYLADVFPEAKLWPADRAARATARSVSAEMHSGFAALRTDLPMNIRAERPRRELFAEVQADIARIRKIWRDCRARFGAGGRFLFGTFGVADAMFAPVVTRFRTYGINLDGGEAAYADAVWHLPALQRWAEAGQKEPWAIAQYEVAT
jgi:glutathione S-transferase